MDPLKDESFIYLERLRKAGVQVELGFYEDGFHGIVTMIDQDIGFNVARKMLDDLIKYIAKNI
jgi:hypothetical protein